MGALGCNQGFDIKVVGNSRGAFYTDDDILLENGISVSYYFMNVITNFKDLCPDKRDKSIN